uniref:CASP C-terminal domain-containing protein n=1 Tax=Onchocerca volvulus TaxID=6282 RepID=A0A8R1Y1P7_ONCVO
MFKGMDGKKQIPAVISVKIENDAAEVLYEDKYEKHLDAFRKFSFQERQRKYGQLQAYDKAVLGLVYFL